MKGISIVLTLRNRANLLKYCLESISRQLYDGPIEVCIADGDSDDNLMNIIDRYSDVITFKYAISDRSKAPIAISSNMPCADLNTAIKNMASYDVILKIDPEIILKDNWILQEIVDNLINDESRTYNARTHFTEGEEWYTTYEDIVNNFDKHYHYAEGGPFSRSKFYFCCGFSKNKFIEMGGIDEIFSYGVGFDDSHFREVWKNRYGSYEKEITGQAIHLWHGPNKSPSSWEELNRRIFNLIKNYDKTNIIRLVHDKRLQINKDSVPWGLPDMLSKIYTIKDGSIIDIVSPFDDAKSLDLPF